jgi:hypothetical protein
MSRKLEILFVATALAVLGAGMAPAAPAQTPATTAASADALPPTSEPLQEVTVTAHRAELAPKVARFVNQIAAIENDTGLPRWRTPVCPLVSGLPRQEGEYVLGRISEVARADGIPLGAEHCRPNLDIVISARPKELLKAIEKRYYFLSDEGVAPTPVRVWYSSAMRTPEGLPMSICYGHPCNPNSMGSRVNFDGVYFLGTVFVVADANRLHGVTRGQFADYVAMVGLAKLKLGAHLDDAPTILKLFNGEPQDAPAGMSDWDQAFLRSLYATDQKSKGQRNQIAHQILHEIAP